VEIIEHGTIVSCSLFVVRCGGGGRRHTYVTHYQCLAAVLKVSGEGEGDFFL
jgi:hypothetical protein